MRYLCEMETFNGKQLLNYHLPKNPWATFLNYRQRVFQHATICDMDKLLTVSVKCFEGFYRGDVHTLQTVDCAGIGFLPRTNCENLLSEFEDFPSWGVQLWKSDGYLLWLSGLWSSKSLDHYVRDYGYHFRSMTKDLFTQSSNTLRKKVRSREPLEQGYALS